MSIIGNITPSINITPSTTTVQNSVGTTNSGRKVVAIIPTNKVTHLSPNSTQSIPIKERQTIIHHDTSGLSTINQQSLSLQDAKSIAQHLVAMNSNLSFLSAKVENLEDFHAFLNSDIGQKIISKLDAYGLENLGKDVLQNAKNLIKWSEISTPPPCSKSTH